MLISDRFPYLEVVLTIGTWTVVDWAYIDTGFESGLLIPARLSQAIPAHSDRVPFRMADGVLVSAPFWSGTLELNGQEFPVDVAAIGQRFLLGRQITDRFNICFEFGRRVAVTFAD